jgi:hypothetical protein
MRDKTIHAKQGERGFRDLKSTLDLRPVFHRVEPRIRAHVLLCWLALLLIRVAERRTGPTWRRIALELGRLHTVTLTGNAGSAVQTTPPDPRPSEHSSGLPGQPATVDHRAEPLLTCANALHGTTRRHGHTRPPRRSARSCRSTARSTMIMCPPTAESGADGRGGPEGGHPALAASAVVSPLPGAAADEDETGRRRRHRR